MVRYADGSTTHTHAQMYGMPFVTKVYCRSFIYQRLSTYVIVHIFEFIATVSETVDEHSSNKTNQRHCEVTEIFIGLAVVFIVISVITTTISVILSWKLCSQKRNKGNL